METHAMRPRRSRLKPARAFFGAVGAICAGMAISMTLSTSAHAAPQNPQQIEAEIDDAWNKLEPIIEQHDNVQAQLQDNQAKASQLAEQIRPLALQVDLAMGRVSSISAEAYKNGQASQLNALLSSTSPSTFADQLSTLDAMARGQEAQVADAARAKAQYDKQKQPLDKLVKQLSAQEAQLAAQEKSINDQINQYNQMRIAAYGSTQDKGALRPAACPASYTGGTGSKAAQAACGKIGSPYVFGASGPRTFDCSGLTGWAWSQATGGRVSLYHYTVTQYNDTKRVSRDSLQDGDLVFYFSSIHHVALYVGGGWVVQAPHTGDVVRMTKMDAIGPIKGYGRPG